ncbi:hypothetical protein RZO55_10850 [Clostridium boliviensis]|uniref:SRPBCC family protein n=1 Tax=Clostridium boliviensis TaxID=318465 RepID=A0ABU4GM80_9CLOT|nr:hypothetical protein [Clostridium boliviensis]MDW2798073.1 hypothetical protein [Clostridium boliviensis]
MDWLNNEEKIEIRSQVYIPISQDQIDIVFDHVYDREKFHKWFDFMPALWISYDRKQLETGCIGTIWFTMPLFYYKLKVTEVVMGKSIVLKSAGGPMRGKAYFNLHPADGGVILENIHILSGKNKFLHYYYVFCLVPNHLAFMNWRYSVLKKQIKKELERNKKSHK